MARRAIVVLGSLGLITLLGGCGTRMVRTLPDPPMRAVAVAAIADRNPVIQAFSANPGTRVALGQAVTFHVVAFDAQDDVLAYHWAATGGTLSTTTGQIVSWQPPTAPGVYAVTVLVTNRRGGTDTAVLNLTVGS